MRPLFERERPAPLSVPSAVVFAASLFREESLREVRRVDPGARVAEGAALGEAVPEGVVVVLERPFGEVAAELRARATFVRAIQPIERVEEVADLAGIVAAVRRARAKAGAGRVDLVGMPRGLTRRVMRETASGPGTGTGTLSVLVAGGRVYFGAGEPISPWPAGDPAYAIELVSRAGAKLREALGYLDPPLPEGASCLDLGAAPGGFTSVLLERGARVLAVDPAPLAERLEGPGLTFRRGYAQDVPLEEVPELDLIACDAVCAPAEVAGFVARFAPRLRPGGRAIVTLKLRSTAAGDDQLRGAADLFAPALALTRTRHLFANRREVTAFLERPGA